MKEYIIQFDEEANNVPTFIKEQFLGLYSDRELIRCKDCKHCEVITIFGKDFPACTLRKPAMDVSMDDYCSKAEKKEYESVDEGNQG